ncbi:MAG: putative DNA binding domain-containing protein [Chloroflexi bacterium]|nr:putative DNA binding domain-containing protein [Chloroflexota bacterium]
MDLHLHTPASSDYQEPKVTWLDILRRAETRGLDIIGIADHNTVDGYRTLRAELDELQLLERLNRLRPDEKKRLDDYRRLLAKILVLPGFEFTATFGFHIIGLFDPATLVRDLEHILLNLNVPSSQLDLGSSTVGATADVLTAYRLFDEAGGIVIAAHANSSNGVAMRGFNFGGQTKIAYTQDPHLHALEVTDLEHKSRRTTAAFFDGSKSEYPRRMHCIQGSDSHRLRGDGKNVKNLGLGDRATEVMLEEVTFAALRRLFLGDDFSATRPARAAADETFDDVQAARLLGPGPAQSFHPVLSFRGGKLNPVLADVCAFANTGGGVVYIGASGDARHAPAGLAQAASALAKLQKEISAKITPALNVTIDKQETRGKVVLRVVVPRGDETPYAVDGNQIFLRRDTETTLAVRDEIVQLITRGRRSLTAALPPVDTGAPVADQPAAQPRRSRSRRSRSGARAHAAVAPRSTPAPERPPESVVAGGPLPRTGVEIVASENRKGKLYHTVRDLRNGNVVKNVTRSSARHLWRYAILQLETAAPDEAAIEWRGDAALIGTQHIGAISRYDFAQRNPGGMRLFYGVTDDGLPDEWKALVSASEA